jgi:hypothetical protein
MQTVLAHESGDPRVQFDENNQSSKISWDCPFKPRDILILTFQFSSLGETELPLDKLAGSKLSFRKLKTIIVSRRYYCTKRMY